MTRDWNDRLREGEAIDPDAPGELLREGAAPVPQGRPKLPWRTVGDWSEADGADWLMTNPPARRWLAWNERINGIGVLSREIVGILASAGGVGKTFALCELAALVAGGGTAKHGRLWLDRFAVEGGPVLFLAGEETADELRRRLFAVVRRCELRPEGLDAIRRNLVIVPTAGVSDLPLLRLDSCGNLRPSNRHTEIVDRLSAPPDGDGWALVLVDPMVRWAAGEIDRDNMAAAALIGAFETFTKAPGGPTVLVAHHTSKDSRKGGAETPTGEAATAGVRGASAITDNARWVATLEPNTEPDRVRFAVVKSNYGQRQSVELVRTDNGPFRGLKPDERRGAQRARKTSPRPNDEGAF